MIKRIIARFSITIMMAFSLLVLDDGNTRGGCNQDSCGGIYERCGKQYGFPAVIVCEGNTQLSIRQVKYCLQVSACDAVYQDWVE